MEKCVACQFYDRDDTHAKDKGVRWGKCRRTGPIVHPIATKSYMVEGLWPSVRDDDWCGEWVASRRRPDGAAAGAMSSLLMHAASPARAAAGGPAVSLLAPLASTAPDAESPVAPIAERFGSD